MKKIVYQDIFPEDEYMPVEDKGNVQKYVYLRIRSQPQFLIYKQSFRCPPSLSKDRIIAEIDVFQQYKYDMYVADRAYIFQSNGQLNIFLRTRSHKSKTLEATMKAKKQAKSGQSLIQKMQMLALAVQKLHLNNHSHGRINLSNIICRKNGKVKLGMPDYLQIQKWRKDQDSYYQHAPKGSIKSGIHTSSDLFSLGFVFLQMMIGQVLPQNSPLSELLGKLPLVQDPNIRKLIMLMLKQQINILEIPRILDNPQDKDNLALLNLKDEDSSKYKIFKFFLFRQAQSSKVSKAINERASIIKHHSANLGPIEFIFSEDDSLLVRLVTKDSIEILADISLCFSEKKKEFSWLDRENFQKIIFDNTTKFDLSIEGDLLMFCLIDTIKQLNEKMSNSVKSSIPNFKNSCRIFEKQKQVRKGLIITEQIVLTIFLQHQPIEVSSLFFGLPGIRQQCLLRSDDAKKYQRLLQKDKIGLKYTIVCVNFHNISVELKNYLKFVKDYSQEKALEKLAQKNGATFSYQLGATIIAPGGIAFHQSSFQLKSPKIEQSKIPCGQLLRVIFSTNCSAVIGIHVKDGKGFLINDDFQVKILYNILLQWRSEASLITEPPPLVFIECADLDITEGEIRNINDSTIQRYLETNSIKDRETAYAFFKILEKSEENSSDLGFYHYLVGTQFNKTEPKQIKFHLEMALHYFGLINQQDSIIFSFIYKKLGDLQMEIILKDKTALQPQEKAYIQILYAKGLNSSQPKLNLYIFLSSLLSLINISQDNNLKLKFLIIAHKTCGLLNLRQHQLNISTQIFFNSIPSQGFVTKMDKIRENIIANQFDLVNSEFNQLILHFGKDIQEKKEMEDQFIKIWKTAYLQFMIYCNDITQLASFEDFSKRHVNHCYVHAAPTFEKKAEIIKKQIREQHNS